MMSKIEKDDMISWDDPRRKKAFKGLPYWLRRHITGNERGLQKKEFYRIYYMPNPTFDCAA
jgi:hypothetical protein